LIHLIGVRFGVDTIFYHADISVPMRFFIIFDGGLRTMNPHSLLAKNGLKPENKLS
jgi:hypothetical protein